MMKELSMHILDIVENSIRAKSPIVVITINEDTENNLLSFSIQDQGIGMNEAMIDNIKDPFTTSRTSRKVGLGIPFLAQTCLQCGGDLLVESTPSVGTTVTATMQYNHIDRPPLGDMVNTIHVIVLSHPTVDFKYIHQMNHKEYMLDTKEVKHILDGVPLDDPDVIQWLKDDLTNGIKEIAQINNP